tara:strand:- start:440 stop:631 length:192 start_codon:yes stop_codon:yes gene_type:complete
MTYPLVNLSNMKLRPQTSTQPPIFENGNYEHPWYKHLKKPNPPTKEAVEKAKFKDKTYQWKGK